MDAVRAFNEELSSLASIKPPVSRVKMMSITKLAMKAGKYYKHIVQGVEKFIQKCTPDYKIPGLYVIDSIVRQSRHQFGPDKDLFAARFGRNMATTVTCLLDANIPEDTGRVIRVLNLWQKNEVYSPSVIQPLLDLVASPHDHDLFLTAQRCAAAAFEETMPTVSYAGTPQGGGTGFTGSSRHDPGGESVLPVDNQRSTVVKAISQLLQNQSQPSVPILQQQLQLQLLQQQLLQQLQPEPQPSRSPLSFIDNSLLAQIQALTAALISRSTSENQSTPVQGTSQILNESFSETEADNGGNSTFSRTPRSPVQSTSRHSTVPVHGTIDVDALRSSPSSSDDDDDDGIYVTYSEQAGSYSRQRSKSPSSPTHSSRSHQRRRPPEPDSYTSPINSGSCLTTSHDRSSRRKNTPMSRSRSRSRSRCRSRSRAISESRSYSNERSCDKEWQLSSEPTRHGAAKDKHLCIWSTTLWVGHVHRRTTRDDFRIELVQFGKPDINLIQSRGCAFICFGTRQQAMAALSRLDGSVMHGNVLKATWAPGEGLKQSEFKDKWDVDEGVSYIPWERLPENIVALAKGGVIDDSSLPQHWKKSTDGYVFSLPPSTSSSQLVADSSALPPPVVVDVYSSKSVAVSIPALPPPPALSLQFGGINQPFNPFLPPGAGSFGTYGTQFITNPLGVASSTPGFGPRPPSSFTLPPTMSIDNSGSSNQLVQGIQSILGTSAAANAAAQPTPGIMRSGEIPPLMSTPTGVPPPLPSLMPLGQMYTTFNPSLPPPGFQMVDLSKPPPQITITDPGLAEQSIASTDNTNDDDMDIDDEDDSVSEISSKRDSAVSNAVSTPIVSCERTIRSDTVPKLGTMPSHSSEISASSNSKNRDTVIGHLHDSSSRKEPNGDNEVSSTQDVPNPRDSDDTSSDFESHRKRSLAAAGFEDFGNRFGANSNEIYRSQSSEMSNVQFQSVSMPHSYPSSLGLITSGHQPFSVAPPHAPPPQIFCRNLISPRVSVPDSITVYNNMPCITVSNTLYPRPSLGPIGDSRLINYSTAGTLTGTSSSIGAGYIDSTLRTITSVSPYGTPISGMVTAPGGSRVAGVVDTFNQNVTFSVDHGLSVVQQGSLQQVIVQQPAQSVGGGGQELEQRKQLTHAEALLQQMLGRVTPQSNISGQSIGQSNILGPVQESILGPGPIQDGILGPGPVQSRLLGPASFGQPQGPGNVMQGPVGPVSGQQGLQGAGCGQQIILGSGGQGVLGAGYMQHVLLNAQAGGQQTLQGSGVMQQRMPAQAGCQQISGTLGGIIQGLQGFNQPDVLGLSNSLQMPELGQQRFQGPGSVQQGNPTNGQPGLLELSGSGVGLVGDIQNQLRMLHSNNFTQQFIQERPMLLQSGGMGPPPTNGSPGIFATVQGSSQLLPPGTMHFSVPPPSLPFPSTDLQPTNINSCLPSKPPSLLNLPPPPQPLSSGDEKHIPKLLKMDRHGNMTEAIPEGINSRPGNVADAVFRPGAERLPAPPHRDSHIPIRQIPSLLSNLPPPNPVPLPPPGKFLAGDIRFPVMNNCGESDFDDNRFSSEEIPVCDEEEEEGPVRHLRRSDLRGGRRPISHARFSTRGRGGDDRVVRRGSIEPPMPHGPFIRCGYMEQRGPRHGNNESPMSHGPFFPHGNLDRGLRHATNEHKRFVNRNPQARWRQADSAKPEGDLTAQDAQGVKSDESGLASLKKEIIKKEKACREVKKEEKRGSDGCEEDTACTSQTTEVKPSIEKV